MRLATLAQAMRSTSPTAPMNTSSDGRTSPTMRSCRPTSLMPQPALRVRILALEPAGDRGHLVLGVPEIHPRREPADDLEKIVPAALDGIGRERRPHVHRIGQCQPDGADPDDRVGLPAQDDAAADGVRSPAELPLPVPLAQDRHPPGARPLLLLAEVPSDRDPRAEDAEVVRRHQRAVHHLGLTLFR